MKGTRHPHPHVDPRQPRDGSQPRTNPPLFAWKPFTDGPFTLRVANDPALKDVAFEVDDLADPVYLPEELLSEGTYYWAWEEGGRSSEILGFEITEDSVILEVPAASAWLSRLPEGHPRVYFRPEELDGLAERLRVDRGAFVDRVLETARAELSEPHHMDEPEFLPSREKDYAAFWKIWYPTMWGSRRFVKGAETMALAYLLTGDASLGRAACERMASVSAWDPEGSSYLGHNDEAHMSVIWHGPHACDWVWDLFTDAERENVIAQFRRRGEITFEHMHDRGLYGITRFDSHAGREIVFLAQLSMVFHDHIPEAADWLDWLRPVLCGMWPSWAGDDGGWAQGPSYGQAYVTIMTMFATGLKKGTGIDLYRRPFWAGHALWRYWCFPPYIEWMGFGDHSEKWRDTWLKNAYLVDIISRETVSPEYEDYITAFRAEAESLTTPGARQMAGIESQILAAPAKPEGTAKVAGKDRVLHVFGDVGLAAFRTAPDDRDRDVALMFRSSPYGAISHSHASNNDFFLHAGGKALAMPSGYYAGYGSSHHANWVWHTKSHNCLTLSDAGQIMRSPDSRGEIAHVYEDGRVAYLCGIADASYADRATRCRRHVVFLKGETTFLMVDEFVAVPGIVSAPQWNLHSWNRFEVDEANRTFLVARDGRSLHGTVLWRSNGFFSLTEGWDPPPEAHKNTDDWHMQYHLRYTPNGLVEARNLGVVLCPAHAHLEPAEVRVGEESEAESARIGASSRVEVLTETGADGTVARVEVDGTRYRIGEAGLAVV